MGDFLPDVDLNGLAASAVTVGIAHTCVIVTGGEVKCFGRGNQGITGHGRGSTFHSGLLPSHMGANLSSVDLGTGRIAVEFCSGPIHTCVLLDDSSVKCWGYAYTGELGYGDKVDRGIYSYQMGDNLPAVDLGSGFIPAKLRATRF
eukprot:5315825-Amphidinium_carterae.1